MIKRDKHSKFRFSSLQSDAGQKVVTHFKLDDLDSVFLLDKGQLFTHSDVALTVAEKLGGIYGILGIFKIVPLGLRNKIYYWIAKNRYQWFGKLDQCMIPTPELKELFIA